jgi:hypothetical protein
MTEGGRAYYRLFTRLEEEAAESAVNNRVNAQDPAGVECDETPGP